MADVSQPRRELRWFGLDNAALIFPASLSKKWSNAYRLSFTLKEPVDPQILQQAADRLKHRFPSFYVRLRRGLFWYYLEETEKAPMVREDAYQPLIYMGRLELRRCAIRILYYRSRIAVEYFHSVTDGTGALVFLKSLTAEYLRLKEGCQIPCEDGVLCPDEEPREEELEDLFPKNAGPVSASRDSTNVYRIKNSPEGGGLLHITCGILDQEKVHEKARSYGVSVTGYLTAVLLKSLIHLQEEDVRRPQRRRLVKVQIPVNLRRLYGGQTLRNFVAVANVGVDPRLGEYSLSELCDAVGHQMKLTITPKQMQTIFTPNVRSQQSRFMRLVPRVIKDRVMKAVFEQVGEKVTTLCFSNLGQITVPQEMARHIGRAEFILSPQASSPYNVSAASFGGNLYLNIVRSSRAPRLEREVFCTLVREGFHVKIETNQPT